MRIGYARINQETHCLSPIRTTLEDFQRAHFLVGDALAEAASRKGSEVPGLLKDAELSGVVRALESAGATAVPLSSAWAMPSGPLTRECVVQLRDQLVGELQRAGKLDGLVLAFHGAMGAHGLDEPESWLLEAIRDQVGDIPVVLTLDLHGLVTRRMALAVDAILYSIVDAWVGGPTPTATTRRPGARPPSWSSAWPRGSSRPWPGAACRWSWAAERPWTSWRRCAPSSGT